MKVTLVTGEVTIVPDSAPPTLVIVPGQPERTKSRLKFPFKNKHMIMMCDTHNNVKMKLSRYVTKVHHRSYIRAPLEL